MTILRPGAWLPDLPEFENPGALEALNCFPLTLQSYGAIQALVAQGNALTARCQGAGSFRGIDGTVFNTAFDATKAYQWDGTAWNDVSRLVGGAYAVADADMVSLTQFGNFVIAVNGTDVAQKWEIGSSANYAALGGSPPVGRFVCTIRDFVQIGRIAAAKNQVRWCSINNAEAWTVGTNQADLQDIPEGGQVMGMVGGEYGTVFMERSIYRQTYVGAPAVFQFDRMSEYLGCCCENSIATYEQMTFFLDFDGFYMIQGGQGIKSIGTQKVNDYFWSGARAVNPSYLHRVQGIVDPDAISYSVIYPSVESTDGTPDTMLIYHIALDRWSRVEIDVDYMFRFLSSVGYHTDNIDTVITNTDATAYLTDSNPFFGSGNAQLAAFGTDKKLATFSGSNMAARIDTAEVQLNDGGRAFVSEVWPICDGGTLSVDLGTRDLPTAGVTWNGSVAINSTGFCPFRSNARYHRARIEVAAGGTWTHIQGIRPKFMAAGRF